MPSRRTALTAICGPVVAGAVAVWPGDASAHHVPCSWGAYVVVDAGAAQPVSPTIGLPRWWCEGPRLSVTEGSGQGVEGDATGVRFTEEPPDPTGDAGPDPRMQHARLRLRVTPGVVRARERTRFRFRAIWLVQGFEWRPGSDVVIRFAGRRIKTDDAGIATVVTRLRRPGSVLAVATRGGRRAAEASVRARAARRR